MSPNPFLSLSAWRPMLTQFLSGLAPVETEPPAYPFAPTDVSRLHRLTATDDAAIDDQTWRDLLIDRYADSLSGEVSIFGRQELHRRLDRPTAWPCWRSAASAWISRGKRSGWRRGWRASGKR